MLPWPNVMSAQPMGPWRMDGYRREDKDFKSSLNCQHVKFFHSLSIIYEKIRWDMMLLKELVSADDSEDTFMNVPYSRAVVQHPIDGKAMQTGKKSAWTLVRCVRRGWWQCEGAVLISQGSWSQLHSTNDLFNAWHSGAGLKESCRLGSCLWDVAWVSDRLHHDSEHGVSWRAQTDNMSHDSAIQSKVSSAWVHCKSLSFYVESFNMGIFSLFLEIFPAVFRFSSSEVILRDSMKSFALSPSVRAALSQGLPGYPLWSLRHHTLPKDLPKSLRPV